MPTAAERRTAFRDPYLILVHSSLTRTFSTIRSHNGSHRQYIPQDLPPQEDRSACLQCRSRCYGEVVADDPNHVHTAACFVDFEPLAVVELFQSQGCVACPPTVPEIIEATTNPNVLLLSYNVTIFDHLGWKDTFATPDSDRRHREYAKAWNRTSLFTPQVVASGAVDGNGAGGRNDITDLVSRARTAHKAMGWNIYLDANDTEFRIDTDRAEAEVHNILLVIYRSGDEIVKAGRGPNKGKKLKHRNVVKQILKIGEWQGGNLIQALPAPKSSMGRGEEAAILVQAVGGGPIIAAVKV